MVPVTTWQAMSLIKNCLNYILCLCTRVFEDSAGAPKILADSRRQQVAGDVEEHRKQCQVQLYLIQVIVPRHTVGNI